MREGNVAIAAIPQFDRQTKKRPVVLLREMPLYRDFLVCGISSQLRRRVPDFDEVIDPADDDFASSGLVSASVVRLSFVVVVPRTEIVGTIGSLSLERHQRLLKSLGSYLLGELPVS
jgi:mRNA interferase MazF